LTVKAKIGIIKIHPRGGTEYPRKILKSFQKTLKKVLTKRERGDIISKLSRKAVARSSLKIEQQDERKTPKILLNFIKCCIEYNSSFK